MRRGHTTIKFMKNLILILCIVSIGLIGPDVLADTSASPVPGKQVTFTVTNDGTAPFTYQWKKNGTDIPGATGQSFVITSIKAVDAGIYTVQITNNAGTVLSDRASISVAVTPTTGTIQVTIL
jgi:hypothetical protein